MSSLLSHLVQVHIHIGAETPNGLTPQKTTLLLIEATDLQPM